MDALPGKMTVDEVLIIRSLVRLSETRETLLSVIASIDADLAVLQQDLRALRETRFG